MDIVVHNAGIKKDKTIAKMTDAAWQNVIDINLSVQERINDASISGIAGNLGQTNCDVAQTIAWFAHPGSASVTGQIVRVCCGQSLIGA